MADVQKPVEVPATTPAVAAEPVVPETTPAVDTTTTTTETPAVTEAKTEETPAAEAAAPVEGTKEAKKEVTPIEKGRLDHKASPASFPKNLIFSSQEFWFGSEPVTSDKLSHYIQSEKATDVAHHVAAWASETGKGLLFFGKESSKPTGVIQLAEASEPTTDGHQKFTVVTKGHKHVFKAANAAERDNWVEQLKLKIAEAKELATTVTESETYKKTLETLKPTPAAKKEEEPVVAAETPAAPAATEEPAALAAEAPKEEAKEEPKRRSASRKRTSIFGSLLNKKEEVKEKKEEKKEEKTAEETPAVVEPTTEAAPVTEAAVAPAAAEAPVETTEAAPIAAEEKPVEAAKEKPAPAKRQSLFGSLSFGKKRAEPETVAAPAKETSPVPETAPVTDNAPVIPAVETTEPLSAEVASPATVPTETTEVAAPATNGEKKEVKSEKRKSSLPFAFGKKEKSATSDEETEKKSSPFSKLRQTIKGKGKTEKVAPVEETPAVPETATEAATEEKAVEPVAAEAEAAPATEGPVAAAEESAADKPTTTPAVAATA